MNVLIKKQKTEYEIEAEVVNGESPYVAISPWIILSSRGYKLLIHI